MISKESTVKKIQKEISSQKYDEAIKLIEHNKRNLVEIDYWYYLSLCARYSKKHNEALVISVSYTHLTLPTIAIV